MEVSINCIQDYLRERDVGKLMIDASDYLYTAIGSLKKLKENYISNKIKDIANG